MKKPLLLGIILTVCIVVVAFVFAQFYPEGMVSYWKFDDVSGPTASDSVGENDGTVFGAAWTTGQVNGALDFNGVDDSVVIPDDNSLDITGDLTLEAWIEPDSVSYVAQGEIIGKWVAGDASYYFAIREGELQMRISANGGDYYKIEETSSANLSINTWYHVVGVYDASEQDIKLYVNGDEEGTTVTGIIPSSIHSGFANVNIGGWWPGYYFDGKIDEAAIYNRALTPEEIQRHYQDGLHGLGYDVQCAPPPPGLVSWWPGDVNAEDIWDANDGTLQNEAAYAAGRVDMAFSFDGVDDYVEVGDMGVTGDWTIDFWAKLDTVAPTIQYPIGMGPCAGITYGTGIFMAYSNERWGVYDGLNYFLGSPTLANIWYHIAVTKSGTTYTIYLDGNYENSGTLGDIYINNLQIGRRIEPSGSSWADPSGGVWYFNGLIDEVEVFHRALSQSEIQAIYNAGSAGKCRVIEVQIDIKPGSDPNSINLSSAGVIPVAILSSGTFDATEVDPATVTLADAAVKIAGKSGKYLCHIEDVNGDELMDLVCKVLTDELNIEPGDSIAVLAAVTFEGQAIRGEDSIRIVR